jgi:hypothetical protein
MTAAPRAARRAGKVITAVLYPQETGGTDGERPDLIGTPGPGQRHDRNPSASSGTMAWLSLGPQVQVLRRPEPRHCAALAGPCSVAVRSDGQQQPRMRRRSRRDEPSDPRSARRAGHTGSSGAHRGRSPPRTPAGLRDRLTGATLRTRVGLRAIPTTSPRATTPRPGGAPPSTLPIPQRVPLTRRGRATPGRRDSTKAPA